MWWGIRDGFEWLMQGDIEHVTPLTIEDVSRIHFAAVPTSASHGQIPPRTPSISRTGARAACGSMSRCWITIGGDDTAFSAMKLVEKADGRIAWVTCEDDRQRPSRCRPFIILRIPDSPSHGVEIVKNLDVRRADGQPLVLHRHHGRTAGIWPGDWQVGRRDADGASARSSRSAYRLKTIVDSWPDRSFIKRLSYGRRDGWRSSRKAWCRPRSDGSQALEDMSLTPTATCASPRSTSARSSRLSLYRHETFRLEDHDCRQEHRVRTYAAPTRSRWTWSTPATGLLRAKYISRAANSRDDSMQRGTRPIPFSDMRIPRRGAPVCAGSMSTRNGMPSPAATCMRLSVRIFGFAQLAKFASTCGVSLQAFATNSATWLTTSRRALAIDSRAARFVEEGPARRCQSPEPVEDRT